MIAKKMNAQNPLFTSDLIWMMQSPPFAAIIVTLGMRKEQTMIEYIANGMPTWAYVLIGIPIYVIVRRWIER